MQDITQPPGGPDPRMEELLASRSRRIAATTANQHYCPLLTEVQAALNRVGVPPTSRAQVFDRATGEGRR